MRDNALKMAIFFDFLDIIFFLCCLRKYWWFKVQQFFEGGRERSKSTYEKGTTSWTVFLKACFLFIWQKIDHLNLKILSDNPHFVTKVDVFISLKFDHLLLLDKPSTYYCSSNFLACIVLGVITKTGNDHRQPQATMSNQTTNKWPQTNSKRPQFTSKWLQTTSKWPQTATPSHQTKTLTCRFFFPYPVVTRTTLILKNI